MIGTLRIAALAPIRHPIGRPFAGGLEAALWNDVAGLRARGHHVDLIAVEGSDFGPIAEEAFVIPRAEEPEEPLDDVGYPPGYVETALTAIERALVLVGEGGYDVVANHCLHGTPLERVGDTGVPVVTTLHTPVITELVAAHRRGGHSRFLSVSSHTARQWESAGVTSAVVPNGIDPVAWPLGEGGGPLLWFGRLVPEKAPHLAIETARLLGRDLVLVGRIGDEDYAREFVLPQLDDSITYLGERSGEELARLVGDASCVLVTPEWDEPFGLVSVEALFTGTPVAAFAVGGVTEIARDSAGIETVPRGDIAALAAAVERLLSSGVTRPEIRESAMSRYALDVRLAELERHYVDAMQDRERIA